MYFAREFTEDGGPISYGASFASAARLCGNYAGRILKGEARRLAGPVTNEVRAGINLKTAKALGLAVRPFLPPSPLNNSMQHTQVFKVLTALAGSRGLAAHP
jgi:hypothetical protein